MSANTVFIIGAGATRAVSQKNDLPSPLATDFFKDEYLQKFSLVDSLKKFHETDLCDVIGYYFGNKDLINIEEVYSFLEFSEQGYFQTHSEKSVITNSKYQLLNYLHNLLRWEIKYDPSYYETILTKFEKGDTIISFNWDLVLDEVLIRSTEGKVLLSNLNEIINPYKSFDNGDYEELAYKNFHKGYFLKMHGSINWGYCINKQCVRNQVPFLFDIETDYYPNQWSCNYCGGQIDILLMPPHVHKNFQSNRIFNLQARIAFNKISTAKKIVIIGYSFPNFDFEVSSLFRRSKLGLNEEGSELFLEEIHIVDPSVNSRIFMTKVKDIFGLDRSTSSYGHEVEIYKYKNLDLFMEKNYKFKQPI